MEDSLPGTPMNRRAKFDAYSFILDWYKQINEQKTHKQ